MMPFFYNSQYLIYMLPAFLLMMAVQLYVNSSYNKYLRVRSRTGLTGADAAQRLIRANGLANVRLAGVQGHLTDHYDPRTKTLHLSPEVANGPSVASLAVAAHELGHAVQDAEGYFPLRVRALLVPSVSIGSTLGWIFIIVGLLLNWTGLAWIGVAVFSLGAVFALATLPVELNASARARQMLADSGIIYGEEEARGVKRVLNAAALTYVAALITAVMQVLYYVSLVGGMGRRRN